MLRTGWSIPFMAILGIAMLLGATSTQGQMPVTGLSTSVPLTATVGSTFSHVTSSPVPLPTITPYPTLIPDFWQRTESDWVGLAGGVVIAVLGSAFGLWKLWRSAKAQKDLERERREWESQKLLLEHNLELERIRQEKQAEELKQQLAEARRKAEESGLDSLPRVRYMHREASDRLSKGDFENAKQSIVALDRFVLELGDLKDALKMVEGLREDLEDHPSAEDFDFYTEGLDPLSKFEEWESRRRDTLDSVSRFVHWLRSFARPRLDQFPPVSKTLERVKTEAERVISDQEDSLELDGLIKTLQNAEETINEQLAARLW